MYTIAKSVAREKMRLAPALITPIQRLWRIATNVRDLTAAPAGSKLYHEVCMVLGVQWCT
jgi:hypothetical protein